MCSHTTIIQCGSQSLLLSAAMVIAILGGLLMCSLHGGKSKPAAAHGDIAE